MRELAIDELTHVGGGYTSGGVTGTRTRQPSLAVLGTLANFMFVGGETDADGGMMRENESSLGTDDENNKDGSSTQMRSFDADGDGDHSENLYIDGNGQVWYVPPAERDVGDMAVAFPVTVSIHDGDGNFSNTVEGGWQGGPTVTTGVTHHTGTSIVVAEFCGPGVTVVRVD